MIRGDGWLKYSIWDHSSQVKDLYTRRCRLEAEEMTCAAQAVELLAPRVEPGDTLLDAGCGSGYFFHSLRTRNVPVEYWGVDASPSLIEIGQTELPVYGLPSERLTTMRIEDLTGSVDHVVCMNVLSNIDNYHRPLERLLQMAEKSVVIRESIKDGSDYTYVRDDYLDPGCELRVHVNAYDRTEIIRFIESYGFAVEEVEDARSGGKPEMVVGYPHWWTFLIADRTA